MPQCRRASGLRMAVRVAWFCRRARSPSDIPHCWRRAGRTALPQPTPGVTLSGTGRVDPAHRHYRGMSEIMPDARFASLTPLLAPRSIAILGASNDPTRISGRPIAYMKSQGFKGAIYPVNPNRKEVQGLQAYPSVADLPETPDVAIVAIAAEHAVQGVADLAKRGVKG